jgi:hypothetical protein
MEKIKESRMILKPLCHDLILHEIWKKKFYYIEILRISVKENKNI